MYNVMLDNTSNNDTVTLESLSVKVITTTKAKHESLESHSQKIGLRLENILDTNSWVKDILTPKHVVLKKFQIDENYIVSPKS